MLPSLMSNRLTSHARICCARNTRMANHIKTTPGIVKKLRIESLSNRCRLLVIPALGVAALVDPLLAIAQETSQPPAPQVPFWYWHGPWAGSSFWWVCPLMMLFMFFFFGMIFLGFRRSWSERRHHWGAPWHMMDRLSGPATHSALQILNERFARGEIQKDEYEDKKAAILSGGQH
jgi:uncharacterized membrane protein